jgi:hypothetical protein
LLSTFFGIAVTACVPDATGSTGTDEATASGPTGTGDPAAGAANPSDHKSLLAQPVAEQAASRQQMDNPPVVYDKNGKMRVAPMPAGKADPAGSVTNLNPANRATYVVGGTDLVYYYYLEVPLPSYMTDADGGTIRFIMQHEIDGYDQVRIIDEHIGTEYNDNTYGARGRFPGRSGWTRQSGGGEWSWILGDGTAHNLATPWDWAFITDYRWGQGNSVLPGDYIRIYTHPHVTARVVFMD